MGGADRSHLWADHGRHCREPGGEVRTLPRGAGQVRRPIPQEGVYGPADGEVRRRDHPRRDRQEGGRARGGTGEGHPRRDDQPRPDGAEGGALPDRFQEGRHSDSGQRLWHHRRRCCDDRLHGGEGEGVGSQAHGPHRQLRLRGGGPSLHGHRPGLCHAQGA